MFESLNSPSIHIPKNLSEYSQTALRYSNLTPWAGGTAIMTREKSYPSRETDSEILYLGEIEELKRISRNDRMIEVGAAVTLYDIYKNEKSFTPKLLLENIEALGSPLLTSRVTIGGAIATTNPITTIPSSLIVLGANAEIRYIRRKRVKSKWIPISLLVNETKNGITTLPERSIITRVRVSREPKDYYYFKEEGSYIDDVENTVSVSFTAQNGQDTLTNPHLAITFPLQGIVYSKDLDNIFMQLHFPLSGTEFSQFLNIAYTFINVVAPNITMMQKARLNYIFEDMTNKINARVLNPETEEVLQNKGIRFTSYYDDDLKRQG